MVYMATGYMLLTLLPTDLQNIQSDAIERVEYGCQHLTYRQLVKVPAPGDEIIATTTTTTTMGSYDCCYMVATRRRSGWFTGTVLCALRGGHMRCSMRGGM